MESARVVPIFKSGDRALFSNYKPVSVLPFFSKFWKRIVYNRPSLALVDLCDNISNAFDSNEHAIEVFLDLSKAFDTIDHEILFNKLEHYGVRGLPLERAKSYLSDRSQFVEFNNYRSVPQISCELAQGSILGLSFFILYVNDLINASQLETILFADDTN